MGALEVQQEDFIKDSNFLVSVKNEGIKYELSQSMCFENSKKENRKVDIIYKIL